MTQRTTWALLAIALLVGYVVFDIATLAQGQKVSLLTFCSVFLVPAALFGLIERHPARDVATFVALAGGALLVIGWLVR
jgi:drug/metabolite transporter (DMT)-like permease